MEEKTFLNLYDFVNTAERSRKYPQETASALKVALRLFETIITDEEKNSLTVFKERFDQIYRTLFERNKTKFTASSLEVYRKRVLKVISQFEEYGDDPNKFNNWTPKVIIRKKKESKKVQEIKVDEGSEGEIPNSSPIPGSYVKNEIPLRPGKKATLYFPEDINKDDLTRIEAFIAYLKALTKQDMEE